jgi:NitT/TauT family transport system ATP-binding protein
MDSSAFVEFNDVWLAYNDELLAQGQFAVEAIDLRVREGEFIAIVGPSGCGKSTFMKLATGLRKPSRGSIRIDGQPVNGPLKISGMAFQAPSLLPWRTTLDNVLLPLEIVQPYRQQFRDRRAEFAQQARELLHSVGLGGYEDKFPWQLSGGMQQRASIARALSFDADILLMDEPFGALDEIVRDHLNEQLLDLWKRTDKTICFVTHSIPEAVYLSTRIVVMSPRPGRVIDVIDSTLPRERPLDIRETPEFLKIAHRVREGLRAGHSYDD